MKLVKKYPFLGSSVDSNQLSLTVKGLGITLIPVITLIARAFGLDLAEADLTVLITAVAGIVGYVVTITGLFRKYINLEK